MKPTLSDLITEVVEKFVFPDGCLDLGSEEQEIFICSLEERIDEWIKEGWRMSDWINAKKQKPTKEDSPILASSKFYVGFLSIAALYWISEEDGWNGEGWYDHCNEYGMKLEEEMLYWMPLPPPPKDEE